MEKFELSLGSENEEICTHPGFVDELCIKCRLHVQDDSAIPLKYIHKVVLSNILTYSISQ